MVEVKYLIERVVLHYTGLWLTYSIIDQVMI